MQEDIAKVYAIDGTEQGCRVLLSLYFYRRYDSAFDKSGHFGLSDRLGDIEKAFTAASVEEIMQRLPGLGQWGEKIAEKLKGMSPTSLKVLPTVPISNGFERW